MRLRWAVGSAPLMAHHPDLDFQVLDDRWCQDALDADLPLFEQWASELVMGQSPLPPHILEPGGQLLGKHFEALVAFWLESSPHFRLRAHSVQLQSENAPLASSIF